MTDAEQSVPGHGKDVAKAVSAYREATGGAPMNDEEIGYQDQRPLVVAVIHALWSFMVIAFACLVLSDAKRAKVYAWLDSTWERARTPVKLSGDDEEVTG